MQLSCGAWETLKSGDKDWELQPWEYLGRQKAETDDGRSLKDVFFPSISRKGLLYLSLRQHITAWPTQMIQTVSWICSDILTCVSENTQSNTYYKLSKCDFKGPGAMAQWLRSPIALTEDTGSSLRVHMAFTPFCNSNSRVPIALFYPSWAPGRHVMHICACMQAKHSYA